MVISKKQTGFDMGLTPQNLRQSCARGWLLALAGGWLAGGGRLSARLRYSHVGSYGIEIQCIYYMYLWMYLYTTSSYYVLKDVLDLIYYYKRKVGDILSLQVHVDVDLQDCITAVQPYSYEWA